jgi:hypothetical protein
LEQADASTGYEQEYEEGIAQARAHNVDIAKEKEKEEEEEEEKPGAT